MAHIVRGSQSVGRPGKAGGRAGLIRNSEPLHRFQCRADRPMRTIARYLIALVALLACLSMAAQADARQSRKKAIWGPVTLNGKSQFPIYHDLGAGIYEYTLRWPQV